MKHIESTSDFLHYDLIDLTPEWLTEPETIIFHHGVGANSEIWNKWLPVLGPHYRIARFDMRGFGKSATAARADRWTFDSLSRDVIRIADALGVARFHFVGESIGGTVGLVLGLQHADRLHSLTLSNAAYRGGAIRNVDEWAKVLREQGPLAWSRELMPCRFHKDGLTAAEWDWFEAQQASHPVDSIVAARDILVDADLGPQLSQLTLPVLLMHADGSPFVPVEQMAELHTRLPRSELQIFRHARHGLPFSHASECANTLLAFLQRL